MIIGAYNPYSQIDGFTKALLGPDAKICEIGYAWVEDQSEVWDRANQLGQEIAKKIIFRSSNAGDASGA